jgi:VanZ family protein
LFALIWALIILALILIPGQEMPDFGDIFSFDKLAHLGVFAILSFLMIVGFSKQFTFLVLQKSPVKYTLLFAGIYAGMLELGQALIPGRYANFYDLSFNMAGVGVGYLLFLLIYKFSFL